MKKYFFIFLFICFSKPSFSQQTVGLFINDSLSTNGYTLFAPGNNQTTYLIDNCGEVVHTWSSSITPPGVSVYLLENGNLLRTGRIQSSFNGGGVGGRLEIFNWNDELIWRYDYVSPDHHAHHDVAPLPNGNILLIAWDARSVNEADLNGRNPNLSDSEIWSEKVIEIKPVGADEIEVVWEWYLWDHLIQDYDSTRANYGVVSEHPELMDINFGVGGNSDWIHFNAINYNPTLDQIALSSRHLSEVYIIDHSTTTAEAASHSGGNSGKGGDILWRWGNPQSYDRGTNADRKFFGQHDVKWIPEGYPNEGKIMVFNNGQNRPSGSYSSVDIVDPNFSNNMYTINDTEAFKPSELFYTYESNPPQAMFSSNISGAHLLSNGHIFICSGRQGDFIEVDQNNTILWHYKMPINNFGPVSQGTVLNNYNIFRATRYGADYPAFIGKDLTPTAPIELNPLPSDCVIYDFTNTSELTKLEGVEIYNNPFTDFLLVKNKSGETLEIEIFDSMGRLVFSQNTIQGDIEILANDWGNGFYFARIFNKERDRFLVEKLVKH